MNFAPSGRNSFLVYYMYILNKNLPARGIRTCGALISVHSTKGVVTLSYTPVLLVISSPKNALIFDIFGAILVHFLPRIQQLLYAAPPLVR